jgi:hypothetical protein
MSLRFVTPAGPDRGPAHHAIAGATAGAAVTRTGATRAGAITGVPGSTRGVPRSRSHPAAPSPANRVTEGGGPSPTGDPSHSTGSTAPAR